MWLLWIVVAAIAIPIVWYGPGLVRAVIRGQRRLSRVQRLLRDEPDRAERPLVVGALEFDRRRLVDDYLGGGDAQAAEAVLLGQSDRLNRPFDLIDGPSHALTDVMQPVDGSRYLRAFTCVTCGEKRFSGSALFVTREPALVDSTWPGGHVHVECACPEGHRLPGCETDITVN